MASNPLRQQTVVEPGPQNSPATASGAHQPLRDTVAAAALIGMSASWLEHDRMSTRPEIPFIRVGRRAVRYRIADLMTYLDGRTQGALPMVGDGR